MMNSAHRTAHFRQQGMVTVMAVLFLITAVIFVLSQTLRITGSNSIDNSKQMDSTAALFIAESGLERARSILLSQLDIAAVSTACTATTTASTTLGRGSFTLAATALPAGCTSACTNCQVISTGTVGGASRALTQTFNVLAAASAYCNAATTPDCHNQTATNPGVTPAVPPRWALTLPVYPSSSSIWIGVFNTAANSTTCLTTGLGCNMAAINPPISTSWNITSGRVLGLGNILPQAATATTVFQRLAANADVVETGANFPLDPSAVASASVVGAYSDTVSGLGISTIGDSTHLSGQTTDGTATTSSWCNNIAQTANTLVMGFSAHSSSAKSDHLTNVVFNAVTLTNIDSSANHMKSPTSADTAAANDVYSEIWYKSNPAYNYGKWITGQIVTTPVIVNIDIWKQESRAQLLNNAAGVLAKGDVVDPNSCKNGAIGPGTTISGFSATKTGECTATPLYTAGNYICLSPAPSNNGNTCNGSFTGSNLPTLEVTGAVNGGVIALGDLVAGFQVTADTTISSQVTPADPGFSATYRLNLASNNATTARTMVIGGATVSVSGNSVTLANGATLPVTGTLVSVRSVIGNTAVEGNLAQNASVSSLGTTSFVLSTGGVLQNSVAGGAVICGGTCAFFAHTVPAGRTVFGLTLSASPQTDYWAAGFTCLNNVGAPTALSGSGSAINGAIWQEQVK